MNKKILISISLILASSVFAMNSNQAVILEHKAKVTGADSQGKAISGHLNNGPLIYPAKTKGSSNIALKGKAHTLAPTK
ncbi:hypothetical protein [Legionella sp. CNM-4043-24]|uniref:hypothetical protein n=1 Tax=Legionella sp. CNM-4043-24 TaxID=3421646 RepID=UPI00403A8232